MGHTVTQLLRTWNGGDRKAPDRLITYVYRELRAIARRALVHERNSPIHPTELVHEFFLRIRKAEHPQWRDRIHFYGAAAEQMRRVLVDLARRRHAAKRADPVRVLVEATGKQPLDFEALDDALTRLAELNPRQARLVELRFFGGLSIEETATALEISPATVKRDWTAAKAWLFRQLRK